jgi:hypothetical protein
LEGVDAFASVWDSLPNLAANIKSKPCANDGERLPNQGNDFNSLK